MAHCRRKNAGINDAVHTLNPGGAISVIDGCSVIFCVMSAFGGNADIAAKGFYFRF
jgi:hypothetical protein